MRVASQMSLGLLLACSQAQPSVDSQYRGRTRHPPAAQDELHPWCKSNAAEGERIFLLSSDSLGPIRQGTTRDALRTACPGLPDTTWDGAEGIPVIATLLVFRGRRVGLLEWSNDHVERVVISDSSVRTSSDFGVGSLVTDLRVRMGELSAGYDDAGVYVWSGSLPNLSFLLRWRVTDALRVPDEVTRRPDLIPGGAKVQRIILSWR